LCTSANFPPTFTLKGNNNRVSFVQDSNKLQMYEHCYGIVGSTRPIWTSLQASLGGVLRETNEFSRLEQLLVDSTISNMHLVLQRGNHTASKVEEMVDWKALFYLCQKYQIQLSLRNIENFRKLISQ